MLRSGQLPQIVSLIICIVAGLAPPLHDAKGQAGAPPFLGGTLALERRLASPVTLAWEDVPFRYAQQRLAETQMLDLWIDRRVDPTLTLTLDESSVPLSKVCDEIASQLKLGWVSCGDVVYVGPPAAVGELRTLRALGRDAVDSLSPVQKQKWLAPSPWEMPSLAEPRQVVEGVVSGAGMKLLNPEAIPHDLWRGRKLPAMSPADQLTLLLVGFDLTWQIDPAGKGVRVVPIERPVAIEREIDGEALARKAAELASRDKQVTLRREGGRVFLSAPVEQHHQLAGKPVQKARRPAPRSEGKQVYSLTIREQPLLPLLEQLAKKLALELEIAEELKQDSTLAMQRVSFTVSEVPLEELLAAIAEAGGVRVEVVEGTLRVTR